MSSGRSTGWSSRESPPARSTANDGREGGRAVDVPIGAAHRVANAHEDLLVIIEIQRGAYTGEDDIVRLQDDYGRSQPLPC